MPKRRRLPAHKTVREIRRYLRALSQMRIWGNAHQLLLKLIAVVRPDAETMADAEADLVAIVKTFLDSAVQVFGDRRCGGAVLRPEGDGKYLAYWAEANMPPHGDWRFEVGVPNLEGSAGYSFRTNSMAQGVTAKRNGNWYCTDPHYRFREDTSHEPRYRSFICIPLVGPDAEVMGVVCFDSPRVDTFHSDEVLRILVEMVDSLAAALIAYQRSLEAMREIAQLKAQVSALGGGGSNNTEDLNSKTKQPGRRPT